jgi:TonB-linked SusC/RagA family outer membrane protein
LLGLAAGLLIPLSAAASLEQKVDINMKGKTLKEFFQKVEAETNYTFMYNDINVSSRINVEAKQTSLADILTEVLTPLSLTYEIDRRQILVKHLPQEPQAEAGEGIRVSGRVTDSQGEPLVGVNVLEKGSGRGVITDADGAYSIRVASGRSVLQFSYLGYTSQELPVGNKRNINLSLHENAQNLDEVVVVGFGVQKKVNLSGSIGTVSSKALQDRPVENIGQALQGTVGNLFVNVGTGQLNAAPTYNIRGYTSINDNDGPMIVIDGIVSDATTLNNLNSNDIENISVLKDASASAIYGSRAAFGVILVTTKSGESDKIQVSYNNSFVFKSPTTRPEIVADPYANMYYLNQMGSYQFPDQIIDYAKQVSQDPSLPKYMLFNGSWTYFESTNWYDQIFKNSSFGTQHDINISGKTDKASYLFSGNYFYNDGLLRPAKEDYNRYNLRSKVNYKLTDWWTLGNNTSFMRNTYDRPNALGNYFYFTPQTMGTYEAIYNPEGTYASAGAMTVGDLKDGGLATTIYNNFQTQINTRIDAIKDVLFFNGNFAYTLAHQGDKSFNTEVPYKRGPDLPYTYGSGSTVTRAYNDLSKTYWDAYASFVKTFGGKHNLSVVLGYSQEHYRDETASTTRNGLITTTYPTPQLATGNITTSEGISTWAMRSAFGRVNYIFDNRYIAEFNGRYDGSSRFPKNDRFVFNPSASLAWVASNEPFFRPLLPVVSHLKVRLSYGQLANQATSIYGYMETMSKGRVTQMLLDGAIVDKVSAPTTLVSGSFTWEKVRTKNLGLDLNFLNNRLSFTGDYYIRDTKDMLTKGKTLPGVLGAAEPKENAADLQTRGWELTLGWRDNVKLAGKTFTYNASFVLSDNRTKITRFDNPTGGLSNYFADLSGNPTNYYVGETIGEIWGLTTEGYFKDEAEIKKHADQSLVSSTAYPLEPGDLKFKDLNGDHVISKGEWTLKDHGDYSIIGNSEPRYTFGLNLGAQWNGFDLSAFFQGVGKRQFYPTTGAVSSSNVDYEFYSYFATQWTHLTPQLYHNIWSESNPDTYYPRLKPGIADVPDRELAAVQTKYLLNAAYIRLKNLTLGYTIPQALISKIKLNRLRLFFSAENLLTFSKLPSFYHVDPEIAGRAANGGGMNYSIQRSLSFGLNVTF